MKTKAAKIILLLFLFSLSQYALAEKKSRPTTRIEGISARNAEIFQRVQDAFDAEDFAEVERLLNKLSRAGHEQPKDKFAGFYAAISNDDLVKAKEHAELFKSDQTLAVSERVNLHKVLGDAYFRTDNLDEALIEYKSILEFGVDRSSDKAGAVTPN